MNRSSVQLKLKCIHYWLIGESINGVAIGRCKFCGEDKIFPTEFELACGSPIDVKNTRGLKRYREILGKKSERGIGNKWKAQYYLNHKKEMIADYLVGGDDLVVQKHHICYSWWGKRKKKWGLVPNKDLRNKGGNFGMATNLPDIN